MKRFAQLSFAAALLLVAAPAAVRADTAPFPSDTSTFQTVDSVESWDSRYMEISGILQGESQARALNFGLQTAEEADRCHKQALLAMERPGRYLFQLGRTPNGGYGTKCKLIRRP